MQKILATMRKILAAAIRAGTAKVGAWKRRIGKRSFWINLVRTGPLVAWQAMTILFGVLYTIIVRLPWVVAIIVIGAIVVQGLTENTTVIKPISVPKVLADSGYTPEVAGQRLRDAMGAYIRNVHSHMRNPEIALHGDLPSIVVPTVGISLDAVVSSVRTLLRSTRSRTLSGEITVKGNRLWLGLRVDGQRFYTSDTGADIEKPDDLLAAAVPDILKKIKPYFVAAALRRENADLAMNYANELILLLPVEHDDLPWMYNLRATIHRERKDYKAATDDLQNALRLSHNRLMVAHATLAGVYADQNLNRQADIHYNEAIKLDSQHSNVRNSYGVFLKKNGKWEEAIASFKKAIALDAKFVLPHNNLGDLLRDRGRRDEAIAAYNDALKLDPESAWARRELEKLTKIERDQKAQK